MKRAFLTVLSLFTFLAALQVQADDVKIIVNSANSVPSLTKSKAADLFLKRHTRWDNGRTVTPVDLSEKNASRAVFCKVLLNKEVAWVKSYWQKMIFSGRATPPVELSSDGEVIDFVRNNPDAIGYVAQATALPATVRVLPVTD